MKILRKIELLAPAKNWETGIAAIDHGADAVYIGVSKYSARSSAGNSLEDIHKLIDYAHTYRVKVYIALNTILYDDELPEVEKTIRELYRMGADALIIQDMGILKLDIPPIPLHASTQCNNRDIEKIKFFENTGFSQVVLARELSLEQIKEISQQTNITLEAFVHGALCVSYSGNCYISEMLKGRSANRGECAQFCRLPYTLQDSSGKMITTDKHLLSLKDLNHSENLEKLLDAGISSLKIEGRLKDISYVKNITAFYRNKLDSLFERRPEFVKSSSGEVSLFFSPDPAKSFNRGFTDYFLHGRNKNMLSPETPKSIGDSIGNIKDIGQNYFTVSGSKRIHNGDGLCFLNQNKELQGFRVNKVENNRIYPAKMPVLQLGLPLFRNFDQEFEKTMAQKTAERKINIDMFLEENNFGFSLTATDEDFCSTTVTVNFPKEKANKSQKENRIQQLSKLGNTPFKLNHFFDNLSENRFIPSSILSELKRKVIAALLSVRKINYRQNRREKPVLFPKYLLENADYTENISNKMAEEFFSQCGVKKIQPALEKTSGKNIPVMYTKYCIKYQLGYCPKYSSGKPETIKEPLMLLTGSHRLKLQFDCKKCEMQVIY